MARIAAPTAVSTLLAFGCSASLDQIPAVYRGDGSSPALGGTTHHWFGSTAIDECTTSRNPGVFDYSAFPPCNWCADAGIALQGPHKGERRYSVCMKLYQCIVQNDCASNVSRCLCGSEPTPSCANDPHPPGPCADLELGSLEETTSTIEHALNNYSSTTLSYPGLCGSRLNYVFQAASAQGCFVATGGK
jgi:hypothetical protein